MSTRRVIAVLALLLCLVPTAVSAEDHKDTLYLQSWAFSRETRIDVNAEVFFSHPSSARRGYFLFAQGAEEDYGQVYGGPTFSPEPWLHLGAGIGVENDPNPLRLASFLFAERGRHSLLVVNENGGTGPWYKVEAMTRLEDHVSLGLHVQRGVGAGPRLAVTFPSTSMSLWAAPMYDWEEEEVNGLFGLRIDF